MRKIGLFAAGVLFGTAGIKLLGSRDAKKVYAHTTAAAPVSYTHLDARLPLFGRQSLFDPAMQKRFQVVVVAVQIIEDARRAQVLQGHL